MRRSGGNVGLALLVVLAQPTPVAAKPVLVDRVVAVIDSEIITLRELEAKARSLAQEGGVKIEPAALRQVLDAEIGERLVQREIERGRDQQAVTDKDVERAVEEVMKVNHLSREQLQSYLFAQSVSWTDYQNKLRGQIERARLMQSRVQGKVHLKDADVRRRCLERQRLGASQPLLCADHILLRLPAEASPEAEAQVRQHAEQLRAALRAGADFAEIARRESADRAAPDGSLGCFGPGEMVEAFEQAAYALAVGDISAPVRTPLGVHLIRVAQRRSASGGACDDEASLEPFRQELYQEEMQRQMALWVGELRKKAFVDVRL